METRERCPVCDRPMARWVANWPDRDKGDCYESVSGWWSVREGSAQLAANDCRSHRVDWKSRALAAESRIRSVAEAVKVMDDDDLCDCRVCQAVRKTRSILTAEVQP